jgi:hypothetical protein
MNIWIYFGATIGIGTLALVIVHFVQAQLIQAREMQMREKEFFTGFGAFLAGEKQDRMVDYLSNLGMHFLQQEAACVSIWRNGKCQEVLHSAGEASTYVQALEQDSNSTFGVKTLQHSGALAIGYLAVTEWRNHSAYKKFGFESYLGHAYTLANGSVIMTEYFSKSPRGHLDTQERRYLQALSAWISQSYQVQNFEKNNIRAA